jgi:hypothetical protein
MLSQAFVCRHRVSWSVVVMSSYLDLQVSQQERSILWEVIVSLILCKNMYMFMCPIPNFFRDRAISLYSTLYRRATRHVLTRVAKCIDVDRGVFKNILY